MVFALLACVMFSYAGSTTICTGIAEHFREGAIRNGLSLCLCLVFYLVGLPLGLFFSANAAWDAIRGRRTKLVDWVLRQSQRR